jgi:hypothetical protein
MEPRAPTTKRKGLYYMKRGRRLIIFLFCSTTFLAACLPIQPASPTPIIDSPTPSSAGITPATTDSSTFVPKATAARLSYNPSPTPLIHWNSNVIVVNWKRYNAISSTAWLSNSIARVATYTDGMNEGIITVDLSQGEDAQPEATLDHEDWLVYSPNKTFMVECHDPMKMIRVSDSKLLSETPLPVWNKYTSDINCEDYIHWSPDEAYLSYIDVIQSAYVWPSNGKAPKKIMEGAWYASWSPDSRQLGVAMTDIHNFTGILKILSPNGQELTEFEVEIGDPLPQSWFTNDVILVRSSRYLSSYYEINSGQLLFQWESMPTGNGIQHQRPRVSPNGRWVFMDQGMQFHNSSVEANRVFPEKDYSLYDLQMKKQVPLVDSVGNYLAYAGWNNDNSRMFVVSLPAESVSMSSPATPFGLLEYDPEEQEFNVLFQDAIQVAWNSDQSQALVVYAEKKAGGKNELECVFWNPKTGERIGPWQVADEMVYRDPANDVFLPSSSGPLAVAWSHDGEKVAIHDKYNRISLLFLNGTTQVLTEDMIPTYPKSALRWSPDDQHILIARDGHAWIVDVSAP